MHLFSIGLEAFRDLLPAFYVIAVGWFLVRAKLFSEDQVSGVITLLLNIALPLYIVLGMLGVPSGLFEQNIWAILIFMGLNPVFFLTAALISKRLGLSWGASSIIGLTFCLPSLAVIGPELLGEFFNTSVTTITITCLVIATNIFSLPMAFALLEVDKCTASSGIVRILPILRIVYLKPVVLAGVIGLAVRLAGLSPHDSVASAARILGDTTGCLGLLAIGMGIGLKPLSLSPKVFIVSALRIVIAPVILWLVLVGIFRLSMDDLVKSMIFGEAFPASVLVAVLSNQYHVFREEANGIVVTTALVSVVTLSIIIVMLGIITPS